MRNLVDSIIRFSWAESLFGVRQMTSGFSRDAARRFDHVASAAQNEISGSISRGAAAFIRGASPSAARAPNPRTPDHGRLDLSSIVVLGEGLAAGMSDFALSEPSQRSSFPALIAAQAGVDFPQTLFEPPGVGAAPGFAPLPVILPSPLQSTVFDRIPPQAPANLSIPGYTLADCLRLRPRQPIVNHADCKQTVANLILAIRDFAYGATDPYPTQLECALRLKPTFAIVELGFTEALEAAIASDPGRMPAASAWRQDFTELLSRLRAGGCDVLALTIPDPADMAYFSTLDQAARIAKIEPDLLAGIWSIPRDSLITLPALNEISFQIFGGTRDALPEGALLSPSTAREISSRVCVLNTIIKETAAREGALIYDLHDLNSRVRRDGIPAGGRTLTADYLDGFYSLNGYYPGATGSAIIAGEILDLLERECGGSFPAIDLSAVMAADPAARAKPAPGPNWTAAQPPPLRTRQAGAPHRPGVQTIQSPRRVPLTLPPGLEQQLPLNPALSYFGDGLMALNETAPPAIQWGSGGDLLFGGLAMVDSHLSGSLHIRFSPPVNGRTRFEISFGPGLTGDDAVLATPQFFKMPFIDNRVNDIPGFVSSGMLDLATGQVDPTPGALNIFAQYTSSALNALVSVNPTFPRPPAAPLSFPGKYGSADIRFEQRADGLLDFTFYGSTFVPLGPGIVWPLNFAGPSMQFATIPAAGTVLHPHLALSTRESPPEEDAVIGEAPEIPFNTIEEFTLFTPVSSFGDVFTLHAPQLGGPATGRSRLLGRMQVQWGPRCADSVPLAISTTTAGGVFAALDPTPIAQLFPGRLTPGPEGFDANLRFPLRTYSLNDLSVIDDPFDIAIGSLDLRTGRLIHPMLHRGFINQDLIFALIRVEPRTPTNSFFFRGDGALAQTHSGARVFRYFGDVHIPYPEGFLFPDPNLATGFPVGAASALDPYLWLWGISSKSSSRGTKSGGADRILSNRGELFSYRFAIPEDPSSGGAEFEYENHSQNGRFRMHALSWVSFGQSLAGAAEPDTVTFSGFGVWIKDGVDQVVQAAAQIFDAPQARWIGIQIGQADISDADTPLPAWFYPVPPPGSPPSV